MTEEVFTRLWGSIKDTDAEAVQEVSFHNETYWGYS